MKETFKVSGKRVALPESAPTGWTFNPRPGGWVIAQSPEGVRTRVMLSEVRGRLSAKLSPGDVWSGEITRDQRAASGASGGTDADLVAQFPGKVRKILTAVGTLVAEGEPLILVEAMKMEFAIKAPFAGTITKILVAEAQQLAPGDRFLDMTPAVPALGDTVAVKDKSSGA